MSWHTEIRQARRVALKNAAKSVKKESIEERLAKVEQINTRILAVEKKVMELEVAKVS